MDLPSGIIGKLTQTNNTNFNLKENEKQIILNCLNSYGKSEYSKLQVAKELGISKATLYRKLEQYNIYETSKFEFEDIT